jgi:hypothetical protein
MGRNSEHWGRRRYLKFTGGAITGTALAGCTGDGEGGGGTTTTSKQDLETVRMVLGPFGIAGIIYDQMLRATDRLSNRMENAGYTVEAKESWEGSAVFASGGPDFTDMSPIEAATLAAERDLNLATNARMTSFFTGWLVKNDGPYDSDTTGGLKASVQKIAEEGKFAIGSWGGGDVHGYKVITPERFGPRFAQNESAFDIVTADYFALPNLVENGEVAAVSTAPHYGAAPIFATDPPVLKALFYTSDMLSKMGYGTSMLNSWVCTQQFADENPGAVKALVGAWEETVQDFVSRPYELATKEKYMEMLAAENKKQAKWLVDWGVKNKYDYETPVLYEDATLTDERIQKEKKFISASEKKGFIPSNWNDRLEFRTVSP